MENINMVYRILSRLGSRGMLSDTVISIPDESAPGKTRTVLGGEVIRITRSLLEYRGGESGYETFTSPLDSVLRVSFQGRTLFLRKKRIERIFPRR
jgi:hypothetical protein